MAEQVLLTIVVDDKGSPAIKQFSQTAQQAFSQVQNSGNQAVTTLTSNMNRLNSSFLEAAKVSLTFRAVNEVFNLVSKGVSTAVKDFLDFDAALREVASIAPEVRNNFAQWRQEIINTNPALGTTTEIAKGLYETFSSGVAAGKSAAEALKFTTDAAELAKAGLTDNATAVKVLSSALNAYGAGLNEATKYSDILFKAVEIGQFRFEELGHSIGPILPLAKTLGIGIGDVSAAVATLTQAGYNASNAITGVKTIFTDLISNAKAFKAAGIDVAAILSQQGLNGLMLELGKVTGLSSEKLKALIPDSRGLQAALSLLSQDAKKVANNFTDVNNASGNTKTAFTEIKKSGKEALADLNAEFDRFIQQFTGQSAIDGFRDIILGIAEAFKVLRTDTVAFTIAAGALATLELIFGTIELAVGSLVYGLGKLGQGVGYVTGLIPGLGAVGTSIKDAGKEVVLFGEEILASGAKHANAFNELDKKVQDFNKRLQETSSVPPVAAKQVDALELLRQASVRATASMLQAEQGTIKVGESSTGAAGKHKAHSDALDQVAKEAVLAGGSLDQIAERFQANATKSLTFEERLKATSEGIRAAGKEADDVTRGGFSSLVNEYVTLTAKALEYQYQLDANSKSMSTEQIDAYKAALETLKAQLTSNASALKEYNVDTEGLQTRVAGVVQANRELAGGLISIDTAYQTLTGQTFEKFLSSTKQQEIAIQKLKDSGNLGREFLLDAVDKAIEGFTKLGRVAPESLIELRREIENLPGALLTVEQAAEKLNIKFDKDLKNSLADDVKAFELLKNSGKSNVVALGNEAQNLVDKYTAAGIKLPVEILAALKRIADRGKEVSEELNKSLNERLKQLGVLLQTEVATKAERVFNTISEGVASGEKDFAGMQKALEDAISDMIATGQRIPPAYTALYEKLVNKSADATERVKQDAQEIEDKYRGVFKNLKDGAEDAGQGIADGIGKGAQQATEKALTALGKLNAQLANFVSVQKFGTDLPTILDQIKQQEQQLANAKDVPGATGYADYVKATAQEALTFLRENLKDAFLEGIDKAKQLAEATGQVQIPQEVLAAAQKLGLDFTRIRQEIEAIAKGGSSSTTSSSSSNSSTSTESLGSSSGSSGSLGAGGSLTSTPTYQIQNPSVNPFGSQVGGNVGSDVNYAAQKLKNTLSQGYPILDAAGNIVGFSAYQPAGGFLGTSTLTVSSTQGSGIYSGTQTTQNIGNPGSHGAQTPSINQGALSGVKFANGTLYANAGQNVQLEAGEAVLTRAEAERYRNFGSRNNNTYGSTSEVTYSSGGGAYNNQYISSQQLSGFTFIPGLGNVPTMSLAAATGRLDQQLGPQGQRDLQRAIIPMVRSSIERRDLTRPISQATSLTRKGSPRIGGS